VQRNVGGVEIEDDLPVRRLAVGLEKEVDEYSLDCCGVMADAMMRPGSPTEACSSRFSVDLPASSRPAALPARRWPARIASTGSWRSWS
jgi:hypothetical protein